jgi:hypothetical protein
VYVGTDVDAVPQAGCLTPFFANSKVTLYESTEDVHRWTPCGP